MLSDRCDDEQVSQATGAAFCGRRRYQGEDLAEDWGQEYADILAGYEDTDFTHI